MNPTQWQASDRLFVFGSLMDSEVLELVCGLSVAELSIKAVTVTGFRQCEVSEESYPVLVADESASCSGLLVGGLTAVAVERILFFEGEEYALHQIDTGNVPERNTYYFRDTGAYTVRSTSWDFEHWQVHHKPSFVGATASYMKLFGQMSAAEADAYWIKFASQ